MYPFEEQVDMILIYGECQQNLVQTRILYSERYPIWGTLKNMVYKEIHFYY